jgi:hypothetical protein
VVVSRDMLVTAGMIMPLHLAALECARPLRCAVCIRPSFLLSAHCDRPCGLPRHAPSIPAAASATVHHLGQPVLYHDHGTCCVAVSTVACSASVSRVWGQECCTSSREKGSHCDSACYYSNRRTPLLHPRVPPTQQLRFRVEMQRQADMVCS